jgi:hypothetical protein
MICLQIIINVVWLFQEKWTILWEFVHDRSKQWIYLNMLDIDSQSYKNDRQESRNDLCSAAASDSEGAVITYRSNELVDCWFFKIDMLIEGSVV